MTTQELTVWLKSQQVNLDSIIAKAAIDFYEQNKARANFGFDLAECQEESWLLVNNQDLCYDRPNTPFVYSLWYHGRRVNTFLSHFAETILNSKENEIEFFDLGAGTGAVQWAVGLVYQKMREAGIATPKIKIINIDTSPFMLNYNKDFLWKHFIEQYPYCKEFDNESNPIEYEVNSWSNKKVSISNPWITASYLFDISDDKDPNYKSSVLNGFNDVIKNYDPTKMLLLTSKSKDHLVDQVSNEFDRNNYSIEKLKSTDLILTGQLERVNKARLGLYNIFKEDLQGYKSESLKNPTAWDDVSFVGTIITKKQREIFPRSTKEGVKLHSASIKIRREIELNEEQLKAAKNIKRPSVIIGPAGCGKSIVITERIKNIVEEEKYNPKLRILLTTFNKELIGQLTQWLSEILDASLIRIEYDKTFFGYIDKPCKIYFRDSQIPNIRLLHFDMLPKMLGAIPYWGLVNNETHKKILSGIIIEIKTKHGITDSKFDDVLNHEFLLEEYQRVIYGLQVGIQDSKDGYLNVQRKGRGIKLDKSKREIVWDCLSIYAKHIYANRIPSFTLRRQLFLSKLKNNEISEIYDYLVVDEFQDCTRADFETFFRLLKDPNNLVISGDLAQAVHLGRSANIESLREAIREGREMQDISWNYLEGSYRLPFRVCEAVRKISEHIHLTFKGNKAASILTPYKGAPPGARPIIVCGKDEEDVSTKILEVIKAYEIFQISEKCILEKDDLLSKKTLVETDTVLRLKGMEKHLVVWSTRSPLEFKKERFEFVYTIVSRTSCLLIIALFNSETQKPTEKTYFDALKLLRHDRLIFWDKQSKQEFHEILKNSDGELNSDEDE